MFDIVARKRNLDSHITFLEEYDSNDERDKVEVKRIQRDLVHTLERILEHYDEMNNEDIQHLLKKTAKVNQLLAEI